MKEIPVEYEITESVPIPVSRGSKSVSTDKLMSMKVGESFIFPKELYPNTASIAVRLKKQHKRVFVFRKSGDNHTRVWRKL